MRSYDTAEKCPFIYSEIIKNGDYLILIDHYYVVFFRKIHADPSGKEGNDNPLLGYCHDTEESKLFDGNDKISCKFANKSINEAYAKVKGNSTVGKLMRESLPRENVEYTVDNTVVSYQWETPEVLKITLSYGSEVYRYDFHK